MANQDRLTEGDSRRQRVHMRKLPLRFTGAFVAVVVKAFRALLLTVKECAVFVPDITGERQ